MSAVKKSTDPAKCPSPHVPFTLETRTNFRYKQIRHMKPAEAIDFLITELSELEVSLYPKPNDPFYDKLSGKKKELFHIMLKAIGRPLSAKRLFDLLYSDVPYSDHPTHASKIIQVMICHIRRIARNTSAPWKISTLRREGYVLSVLNGDETVKEK